MALFIEPGTETVEVAGSDIEIRILTGRERIKLQRAMLKVARIHDRHEPGDVLTRAEALDIQDAYCEALEVGSVAHPDTILPAHWEAVVAEVIKANTVDGEDSKN